VKKVMVIRAYGLDWDYELYMVQDRIAQRIEKLMDDGEWAKAYNLVTENDRTCDFYTKRRNWHSLNTIDLLLEYINGVTV
jgi:phenolic acid decarboxylase